MDNATLIGFIEDALSLSPGTIQESNPLEGLEGWDSIGIISIMAVIEDHCGVSLDPEGLAKCQTVADLVRLVQESMESK